MWARPTGVTVTFTDDDGYSHTLTSLPSGAVAAAQDNVVWSADMAVAEYTEDSIGGAAASQFSNIGGSGNLQIRHLWSHRPRTRTSGWRSPPPSRTRSP